MFKQSLLVWLVACGLLLAGVSAYAGEFEGADAQGRAYFVYTPDTIDPDTTYTLVLAVHGYRGNGRGGAGLRGWVNEHDCIVLSPSYDSDGYQYLQAGSERQTLDLIALLHDQYALNDKIFVFGFSGGAQFAHRFAMAHPGLVAGCAAHSAGTWGTGDYDNAVPNPAARSVLFVISCGENDTGLSFADAPLGRLAWAQRYAGLLAEGGFLYDAQWWPGVGHSRSPGERDMTRDCFVASTQLVPELAAQTETLDAMLSRREYEQAWQAVRALQQRAQDNGDGIIGVVYENYLGSLGPQMGRIDSWAQGRVREAIRSNPDRADRRAALLTLQEAYASLPGASQLIERTLRALGE